MDANRACPPREAPTFLLPLHTVRCSWRCRLLLCGVGCNCAPPLPSAHCHTSPPQPVVTLNATMGHAEPKTPPVPPEDLLASPPSAVHTFPRPAPLCTPQLPRRSHHGRHPPSRTPQSSSIPHQQLPHPQPPSHPAPSPEAKRSARRPPHRRRPQSRGHMPGRRAAAGGRAAADARLRSTDGWARAPARTRARAPVRAPAHPLPSCAQAAWPAASSLRATPAGGAVPSSLRRAPTQP